MENTGLQPVFMKNEFTNTYKCDLHIVNPVFRIQSL